MGYDVHITRRNDWSDTDGDHITLDEWIHYVTNDTELQLAPGADMQYRMADDFQHRPGYCEWRLHSAQDKPDARPSFSYWDGCIYTKNPDTSTIRKMMLIASVLNAKVQGDDGEVYTGELLIKLEEKSNLKTTIQSKKAWWKLW